ncbi:Adenylate kinase 2 [Thecaphora frezii]
MRASSCLRSTLQVSCSGHCFAAARSSHSLFTESSSHRSSTAAPVAHFTSSLCPRLSRTTDRPVLCDNFFVSHRLLRPRGYTTASPSDSQLRMLLVGSPGSGKGTQSTRLLKKYNINVITAGDVLRSHIRRDTDIGKRADEVIRAGGLMPDEVMMELIGSEVEALGDADWLLDGFPRTFGQAKMLDEMLEQRGKQLKMVVNLDVPEEVILDRILQRWTHLPSGRIYNLSFNPPKVPGKDDVTGEVLVQREDDNAETFGKRLASFHKQTEPMLEYYRKKAEASSGVLDIDAKTTEASPATLGKGNELYVNLRGDESKQIWPHLFQIVQHRFPNLAKAT